MKLENAGCAAFFFTERGATFGYNNLVADMRSLLDATVKFSSNLRRDASVHRPGGAGDRTGTTATWPRSWLARVAAGCDGVFIRLMRNPQKLFQMAQTRYLRSLRAFSTNSAASVTKFLLSLALAYTLSTGSLAAQQSPLQQARSHLPGKTPGKPGSEDRYKPGDRHSRSDGVPVKGIKVPSYSPMENC